MNNRIITYAVAILGCLFSVSCSWVKDDLDDCPKGVWLQLEYTYNMLDVDAASNHIDEAYILVYDSLDNFVQQIYADKALLMANGYRVDVSSVPEGKYRFVVWSGMKDKRYMANSTAGFRDFRISAVTDAQQVTSENYSDLYYGMASDVLVDRRYAVHRVSMVKDTNRLVCIVESESEQNEVSTETYGMELVCDNATMNASNLPVPGVACHYAPYSAEDVTIDDPDLGVRQAARFGICTMRLLEASNVRGNARLVLRQKDGGAALFDIPVVEYLAQVAALTEINGRKLSTQEFLDRQDQFTFVFCLSAQNNALIRCKVNNWVLRSKDNVSL